MKEGKMAAAEMRGEQRQWQMIWREQHERREVAQWRVQGPCGNDCGSRGVECSELLMTVEVRHVTVKLLLLIYGSLDRQALKVGKPISSSARCQEFYS